MTLQECFEAAGKTFPFTAHWSELVESYEFIGFHLGPDEEVDGFRYAKGWFTTYVAGFTLVKKQLKLEVGKSYKNRKGKVVNIAKKGHRGERGDIFVGKDGWNYDFDGFWSRGNTNTMDSHAKWDLIEEVMDTKLKLEVGKKYKTRGGWIATITGTANFSDGDFVVKHENKHTIYHPKNDNGRSNISASNPEYDLLEEVMELKLEAGKSYKTRSGAIVKMIYDSKDNLYTYHPDYNGGTSKLFYYTKDNGKCNVHWSYPSTECIEEVKENMKYTLSQILANNKLPVTVMKTGGRDNFGLGPNSYKLNTPLKVIKASSGNVYFEGGGYIGIKSIEGGGLYWEVIGNSVPNETEKPVEIPKPIKLSPEQELFLKEKTTAAQVLLVENNVRLALFSKTMNKVNKEDVEKVVDVVYGKKKGKEFTQKQLNTAINKAVTELYGEDLGQ